MEYKIRRAVPADEQRIRELFIEMLNAIYHTQDVKGYETGYLDKYWTQGEDAVYVAEDNDVVAYLAVEVHRESEKEYVYLDDLSVEEKYRSQGIGSALIHEAEGYAKDIGIQYILFHVEKSNTKAFQLYERLGYKVYRDDGNRYMMIRNDRFLSFRKRQRKSSLRSYITYFRVKQAQISVIRACFFFLILWDVV